MCLGNWANNEYESEKDFIRLQNGTLLLTAVTIVLSPELGPWRRQWWPNGGRWGWWMEPSEAWCLPQLLWKELLPEFQRTQSPHPGISSNNLSLGISQNLCEEKEGQKQQMTQARGLPHWADSNRTFKKCRQLSLPFLHHWFLLQPCC